MVRSTTARDSTVAALAWALVLTSGCARLDSLPNEPANEPAIDGPWEQLYPALTAQDLSVVWGLDADDLWVGGDRGTMLHFDGRRIEDFSLPIYDYVREIDGLATDAVWAIAGSWLFRWDGIAWTAASHMPFTPADFCVVAADEMYFGRRAWADTCLVPRISKYDGHDWTDMVFPYRPHEEITRLWRPSAAHPLLAATENGVFRLRDGIWELARDGVYVRNVDGELGIVRPAWSLNTFLAEFTLDGEVTILCEDNPIGSGYHVIDSRFPLVASSTDLRAIVDCASRYIIEELPRPVYDWAIPRRPGAAGPAVFGVGREAFFVRGVWQAGGAFTWESLIESVTRRLRWPLTGDAERLYAAAGRDLVVSDEEGWRAEEIGFSIDWLRPLGDGRLAVGGYDALAVRAANGKLTHLPSPPVHVNEIWSDGLDAWAAGWGETLWQLADGAWSVADSLPGWAGWIDAREADTLYLLCDSRLVRYDGERFEDLTARPEVSISSCYLAPQSGRIFVHGHVGDGWTAYFAVFDDEQWLEIPDDRYWSSQSICEIDDDLVFAVSDDELVRFTLDGWQPVDDLAQLADQGIETLWGHPDHGLFILTEDSRVFHRDLPGPAGAGR